MIQWSTNRVNPAVAARTAMPGTTRQSTGAAPIASRGAQFRAAQMQRGAPTATQRADKPDDDEDDDKKPKKEPLFSRDEIQDDDGLDDENTPDDNKTDGEDEDDDKDVIIVVA